jgi:hypothetical protein
MTLWGRVLISHRSRRFAPRRGVDSPPGQELLGVITSHGPSRESYRSYRKSRGSAEAFGPPAADAALSAERMRAALSAAAGTPAILLRGMPGGGTEMVAAESPRKIPGNGGGPTKTEGAKPALPGAREKPEAGRARGSSGGREGHHYRTFFSTIRATGLAAMWGSCVRGEAPCSTSARQSAGARWSASGNESSDGNRGAT